MLYIEHKNGYQTQYILGARTQMFRDEQEQQAAVHNPPITVCADREELEHIRQTFVNLPIQLNRPFQTWRGDLARFIVENWHES